MPSPTEGRKADYIMTQQTLLNAFLRIEHNNVNSLGGVSLYNSSELWAIAVISGCLVPGPGMVEAREYCFLGYGGQIEEIWIVSLYIKVMLLAEPFANSNN